MNTRPAGGIAAPEAREPRPAADEPALAGKRVVIAAQDGDTGMRMHLRDYRAASPVEVDPLTGAEYVVVVPEAAWYAWLADESQHKTPRCPGGRTWPADQVWVE